MEEEFNLKNEIKRLKEKMDGEDSEKEKKKKKFKIPFKGRLKKRDLKNNMVTVFFIQNNRVMDIFKTEISEGTSMIKGIPIITTVDDMLYYEKNPVIILPEWSVKPFSPSENYEKTVIEKLTSAGYSLLMNRMMKEAILLKKKMSGLLIIGIIIAIIIGAVILLGGGKWIGLG